MSKKIYLVAGHGNGDSGAIGNGYKEETLTRKVVNALYEKLKGKAIVVRYPTERDLIQTQDYDFFPVDAEVVEIHFNSFNDSSANGTEVLIKDGFTADVMDNAIFLAMSKYFRARRIVSRSDLGNMNYFARVGISYRLVEICFISNKNDINIFNKNFDKIISDLAVAISGNSAVASTPPKETILYTATVGNGGLKLRSTPTNVKSSNVIVQMPKGTVLNIVKEQKDGWIKVKATVVGKNYSGWVFKDFVTILGDTSFKVKVTTEALNIRSGAGTNHAVVGDIRDYGTYTIVQTYGNWGKLKSGKGWICLDYTERV